MYVWHAQHQEAEDREEEVRLGNDGDSISLQHFVRQRAAQQREEEERDHQRHVKLRCAAGLDENQDAGKDEFLEVVDQLKPCAQSSGCHRCQSAGLDWSYSQ